MEPDKTLMTPDTLISMALEAMKAAYSPYSRFRVGAVVLDEAGRAHAGCNVENASYGATICAERTAAVKAVSEGARRIEAIAVVSDSPHDTMPCGICRQFLSEFAGPEVPVYCGNADGVWHAYRMADFLPHAFGAADLSDVPGMASRNAHSPETTGG